MKNLTMKNEQKMNLSSNALLPVVQAYLINNMDFDGYELEKEPTTNNEKLKAFYDIFISEYGFMVDRMGQRMALREYLQGLPSCLTVKFYNGDIYNWLVEIGAATGTENDDRVHALVNNYWNVIPAKLSSMLNNSVVNK